MEQQKENTRDEAFLSASTSPPFQAGSGISALTFQILVCDWNNGDPSLQPPELCSEQGLAGSASHTAPPQMHDDKRDKAVIKKNTINNTRGDNRTAELCTVFLHMLLTHEVGNSEPFFNEHPGG